MIRQGSLIPVLLVFILIILSIGTLHAAPSEQDWHKLNSAVIEQHVIPRYQALTKSSAHLAQTVEGFCSQQQTIDAAQNAFIDAFSQWQGIQHVQFGPVTLLMRNHSFQYWPDKKNTGARQLRAVLSGPDTTFNESFFRQASISLKGFPALERMLFDMTPTLQPATKSCDLASAIAANIHKLSEGTLTDWQAESQAIKDAGNNDLYESAEEAATELMKSLVEPIEVIRDSKILRPLGDKPSKTNWKRSESWRSKRSITNLGINLSTLQHLYSGTHGSSTKALLAIEDATLAESIDRQFSALLNKLQHIPEIESTLVSDNQRARLIEVASDLKNLHVDLEQAMALLNIQLGFNSRDGD